jgi:hypothetical protein
LPKVGAGFHSLTDADGGHEGRCRHIAERHAQVLTVAGEGYGSVAIN